MDKVSPMDLFAGIRKAIQDALKTNPNLTAKDVLDMLELTEDIFSIMLKKIK